MPGPMKRSTIPMPGNPLNSVYPISTEGLVYYYRIHHAFMCNEIDASLLSEHRCGGTTGCNQTSVKDVL